MAALLDQLAPYLNANTLGALGGQIGAQPEQVQSALGAALPALIGGLARSAQQPQGAQALDSALARDHDGSLLDQLGPLLGSLGGGQRSGLGGGLGGLIGGVLGGGGQQSGLGGLLGSVLGGGGRATDGGGILDHVLGGQRAQVEQGVSRASGLDRGQVVQLLVAVAPLVMGALGKVKQQRGLDASGVASVLEQEREETRQRLPGEAATGIERLLDADGDGSIMDDLGSLGASAFGSLMRGRR
jgi:hypothetical protein